jgi:flagellar motility protein MotE (MotC chaperone)
MEEMAEERSYSKLEWFFYIIFIPLLFTLVLSAIIAQMFGYNVVGVLAKGLNTVPIVEKVIPDSAFESASDKKKEKDVDEKDIKISELEAKLDAKERELKKVQKAMEEEKRRAIQWQQQQAQANAAAAVEKQKADEEEQKQIKSIAKIYTSMSAGKAAPILEKMAPEEAVQLLQVMKPEERSAIIAKMDPKKAADLSLLLKDAAVAGELDMLQQQIGQVKNNASVREVADSISSMAPASAADLIERLFKSDENRTVLILKQMNADQRGQILSKMAENKNQAALAARISQKLLAY